MDLSFVKPPFPSRQSPNLERCRTVHMEWMRQSGLLPDEATEHAYAAMDSSLLACLACPDAREEGLSLLNDLIGWGFTFDDSFDEGKAREATSGPLGASLAAYRAVLHGRDVDHKEDPIFVAWCGLFRRLCLLTSESFGHHHRRNWELLFAGVEQEARNKLEGHVPCLREYERLRRATSGLALAIDWAATIGNFEISPDTYNHELVQSLRCDTQDAAAMINDLVSLQQEASGGSTNNVVMVLVQERSCSQMEAVDVACKMIRSCIDNLQRTEKCLTASSFYASMADLERERLDGYIDAMKHLMRGYYEWHLVTGRYASKDEGTGRLAAKPVP
ncbi:hypothetical protein HIM_01558 [Hirsutella minnesotensis 3608]|nr:hypothetical protein HIM_01558 [Hirsutella minnesotensis 3608]